MTPTWHDSTPIEHQLRAYIVAMMLDGVLQEGDPLPSIRHLATELQLHPQIVSKAYQALADARLVEKNHDLELFIKDGARQTLLHTERERFLREEWPLLRQRLQRLQLDLPTLLHETLAEPPP